MTQEEILCISYFDAIIGPNTFYCNENISDKRDFPNLQRIIEFNDEEGTFIFAHRKFQSIHKIFYVPNELARGGKDLVMISYMIRAAYFKKEISDVFMYLDSKTPFLEEFAKKISELEEFPVILHKNKNINGENNLLYLGSELLRSEFLQIYRNTFNKISLRNGESSLKNIDDDIKKIFIYGSQNVGKTPFLRTAEIIQFYKQEKLDLSTKLLEVIIDNMEIVYEECLNKDFDCDQCGKNNRCIKKAQGFILIFNVSDKKSIIEAKKKFDIITNHYYNHEPVNSIPILIIGNKLKQEEYISQDEIYKSFIIEDIDNPLMNLKYFSVDLLGDDKKTGQALRWLVKNII